MKSKMPTSRAKTAYGLLSEIRRLILAEPLRYNQHRWIARGKIAKQMYEVVPDCGTVGCVAGWTCTLKAPASIHGDSELLSPASRLLGLTGEQAQELFDGEAAGSTRGETQTMAHARKGAKHITAFQRKYAAQLKAKRV